MTPTPEALMEQYAVDYMEKVFYFCLRKCGDPTEAEDLASDITCQIMLALRKGTIPMSFAGWVWRIARNRYSRWADAKNRRSQLISGDELPAEPGIIDEDDGTDPELLNALRRELAFIREDYRRVLVAHYIDDRTVQDIADELGVPRSTVLSKLHRARKHMKEGMNMAREFGVRSYKPEEIEFTNNCDSFGAFGQPWRILNHPLYQNIFLEVYDTPETAEELAIALGVALPYMQSELDFLVRETFLTTVETSAGVKYQTAFPIVSRDAWQACNQRQMELRDELTDLLETLIDRYVALCRAHGVEPYGGVQDYETAKWALLMLTLDSLHYEPGSHSSRPESGWTKRPDGGYWDIIGYQGKTNAKVSDGSRVINIPEYFVGQHGSPSENVLFQQYKFYYNHICDRTPEFLDDRLADLLGDVVRCEAVGEAYAYDPASLDELVRIGYLRRTEDGYKPAVLLFDKADRTTVFTPAEKEELHGLVARIREIILGAKEYARGILTADLPARMREDKHLLATVLIGRGVKRELVFERAVSDGWLTDTGDPAMGAYIMQST
ncbi:MAG: sigma-70 family RNA polymerase sigma factor [Clostridia bacterium]|nr:sigma-70 family RNA polymerase sigma factor [Clostridia bacterium]